MKAPTRVVLVVTLPVLVLLVLAGVRSVARSRTFQLFGTLVAEAHPRERIVALTLDDGPVEPVVDSLIGVLRAHGAHATFFLTGRELAAAPQAGAKLVAAGHELANHSYTHGRMILVTPSRVRDEVERTDSLLRAAGQRGPVWFRPPFGYKLVGLPRYLAATGRTTVMWSIEPDSYRDVAESSAGIVRHVLDRVRPGSIIILHPWYASRRTSREAIGPLVDSLHARGYRVETVGTLLGASSSDGRH
ncbi:MAG TPA: polysaccharide deacetylase family protein [Gemmatimonadaceae bacterium]|nr:polysaccharide deacetylase family protein [Gemmatimonadaceae bacterium]